MSGFSKGVLLKGLPFSCTKEDIRAFFKAIVILDENIHILKYRDGKATGLAFVKLSNQEEVNHACLMDKNHIGPRYVDVVASNEVELYQLLLETRSGTAASELYRMAGASNKPGGSGSRDDTQLSKARDRSPIRAKLNTRFCYISGIPQGNNYKEVRRFLAGCLIGRNCIHLCKGAKGVFRGDGYVEFSDSTECLKGLKMSGKMMDGSVIHLEPCTEDEVDEYLREEGQERAERFSRRRDRTPSPVRKRKEAYEATYGREHWERSSDRAHDLAVRESERERDRLRQYYNRYLEQDERRYSPRYDSAASSSVYYPRSSVETRGFYIDSLREDHPKQVHQAGDGYSTTAYAQLQHQHYGRGGGGGPQVPAQIGFHSGGGVGGYADDYPGYRPSPAAPLGLGEDPNGSSLAGLPQERRLVRMEGLPYNVTVQDIFAFFRGFQLDFEHVRIQCRDDGSPSGKAFVVFPSEKHAHAAILECNRRYIGGRYVELFLV